MGEIAEMMLDGTMDPETGEWNFDGEDGPGFPMTGAEAAEWKRASRWGRGRKTDHPHGPGPAVFDVTDRLRKQIEAFGELRQNDAYHWQVRRDRKVVADWWPHKNKWRIDGRNVRGSASDFVRAIAKATGQ